MSDDCTAPVGRRCSVHYTAEDEAMSGVPYPSDWVCRRAAVPYWVGKPDNTRSLAALAAEQGADMRDAAALARWLS